MNLQELTSKRPPKAEKEEVKVGVTPGSIVISDLMAERLKAAKGDRVKIHFNADGEDNENEDMFYLQKSSEEEGGSKLGKTGEGFSFSAQYSWDKLGGSTEVNKFFVPNDVSQEEESGLIGLAFDREEAKQIRKSKSSNEQSDVSLDSEPEMDSPEEL